VNEAVASPESGPIERISEATVRFRRDVDGSSPRAPGIVVDRDMDDLAGLPAGAGERDETTRGIVREVAGNGRPCGRGGLLRRGGRLGRGRGGLRRRLPGGGRRRGLGRRGRRFRRGLDRRCRGGLRRRLGRRLRGRLLRRRWRRAGIFARIGRERACRREHRDQQDDLQDDQGSGQDSGAATGHVTGPPADTRVRDGGCPRRSGESTNLPRMRRGFVGVHVVGSLRRKIEGR
jgi:hypothetical protein